MQDQEFGGGSGIPDAASNNWAMAGHLSGLAGYMIPFGGILGPLVIWLTQRDARPFAGAEALKALNFNITMILAQVVCVVIAVLTCGIGAVLVVVVAIAHLVLCILAAIEVSNGRPYVYPWTIELIR